MSNEPKPLTFTMRHVSGATSTISFSDSTKEEKMFGIEGHLRITSTTPDTKFTISVGKADL